MISTHYCFTLLKADREQIKEACSFDVQKLRYSNVQIERFVSYDSDIKRECDPSGRVTLHSSTAIKGALARPSP